MILLLAASALAFVEPGDSPAHSHQPQLGTVSFETSCSEPAHVLVQRGLGWLHSFEYEQAAQIFSQAAAADPGCAIAHWGVAASYYHPLWAPPNATEIENGSAALGRAKAAGAKSEREREYISALEVFYRDAAKVDHKTRALAYSSALEQLHRNYPNDREASVFYALSLIAVGAMDDDPQFAKEYAAGAILNRVLAEEPNHPGVAHYLIHSFDYPQLAEFALPAARRYAGIAPASPHAHHMPSHIFTRLGFWEESIQSNRKSLEAARNGTTEQRLHAMDYLTYAYLQSGQDAEALRLLAQLNDIEPGGGSRVFQVAYAVTAIPARVALERRQWGEASALALNDNVRRLASLAEFTWAEAHLHFARAVGSARSGNLNAARREVAALRSIEDSMVIPLGAYDWKTQVLIKRQVAQAWTSYVDGRKEEALGLMRAAADLDDATEKHPVTPGSLLPAREQLGELMLELGRPADALVEFEASLKRAPKRLAGLYGAARSAELAGNAEKAGRYYAQIVEQTKVSDGSRAEVKEARAFATQTAQR